MTTRRNILRAASAASVLVAVPAIAFNFQPDPSITAISVYRDAAAAYEAACQRWEDDETEVNVTGAAECRAAHAALTTVPTTVPGLRAFCEFGEWLLAARGRRLSEWWPANNVDVPGVDERDAEAMYFATLATAASRLLPA